MKTISKYLLILYLVFGFAVIAFAGGVPYTGSVGVDEIDATGTKSSSTYLRGDGSWQTPSGFSSSSITSLASWTDTSSGSLDAAVMLWNSSGVNYKLTGENFKDWLDQEGYYNATADLDADLQTLAAPTAWRIFYSNGSQVVTQLALGADGTFLESNGASAAPAFRSLLTTDIPDGITQGGLTFDSSPDTAGELGYSSGLIIYGSNSESLTLLPGSASNQATLTSATGIDTLDASGIGITVKSLTIARASGTTGSSTLYEDPDNGDSYIKHQVPSLAASLTFTMHSAMPTSDYGIECVTTAGIQDYIQNADSTGYVLTNNGKNAKPTWQAASGGVADGDKGDITVASSGASWTVDDNSIQADDIEDMYGYAFIPISWMKNGSSGPGSLETSYTAYETRAFSGTATNDVVFIWEIPDDVTVGGSSNNFWFQVIYGWPVGGTAPSNKGLAFTLEGASVGDNDPAYPASFGSATTLTDLAVTANTGDIGTTAWSGTVTVTDAAAGEVGVFKFTRDHDNASDDFEHDIDIIGVRVRYVKNPTR